MDQPTVLYRNTRSINLRILQAISWCSVIGMAAALWPLHYPAFSEDFWSAVGAIGLFVGLALALEVFLRRYVTALERSGGEIVVETLATVGRRRLTVPRASVVSSGPKTLGSSRRGATQHISLQVGGHRLPFVVDITVDQLRGRL
jgi:hypothetical protein